MLELPIEIAPKPPNPLFFPVCFYRNPARRRLAIANYVSTGTPYVLELPIEIAPKPPNPLFFPVCFYRNPARRRLAIANYVSTGTPYVLELPIEIAPKPPWPLLLDLICNRYLNLIFVVFLSVEAAIIPISRTDGYLYFFSFYRWA